MPDVDKHGGFERPPVANDDRHVADSFTIAVGREVDSESVAAGRDGICKVSTRARECRCIAAMQVFVSEAVPSVAAVFVFAAEPGGTYHDVVLVEYIDKSVPEVAETFASPLCMAHTLVVALQKAGHDAPALLPCAIEFRFNEDSGAHGGRHARLARARPCEG